MKQTKQIKHLQNKNRNQKNEDANQRSRQQREIHANAGRNCVANLQDSTTMESGNGTTSVASRLATTNAGDSSRNSNHQIGG